MGRMGPATGSFDLREGFAGILRSSLAQLACDVVASRMKKGAGPLNIVFVPEATTEPAELNVRAEETASGTIPSYLP